MVDVFDEVEEELRRERYQALLRQWGPWVGAAAAVIVLGVAGYQFIDWRSESTAAAASDRYMAAADLIAEGDLSAADAAFEDLAEDGPRGYATLALMRRGEIALEQGDAAEAARFFTSAAERAPEPLTRDLARYKAALAQFDTLSYDDLSVRLEPLTEGEARFGTLARELIAAAALREERWAQARSRYELLSVALDAPPGVTRRAAEALAYIEQNAPQTAEPAAAEAAPVETAPAEAAPAAAEPAETQPEEDGR
ncbi:MAG: tetratricopeptide repeat protein [Oceanicaulis sp.]